MPSMRITSFDKFAGYYDTVMGKNGDYTHQRTIDPSLFKAIGNCRDLIVYDIGCGNGSIARKFYRKGAKEIWASDISSTLVRIAMKKYPVNGIKYLIRDGCNFDDLPKRHFDIVTLNMSVHYMTSLTRLFSGISDLLKANGKVVFTLDHPLKSVSHFDTKKIEDFNEVLNRAKRYTKTAKETVYNYWTGKKNLVIYKRPLGKYIEVMAQNNLLVTNIIEPKTKAISNYITMKRVESEIPTILALSAVKLPYA